MAHSIFISPASPDLDILRCSFFVLFARLWQDVSRMEDCG